MANSGAEYEQFLADIIQTIISSGRSIDDLKSGATNKVRGASGQDHQVEVSFVNRGNKEAVRVLIECKRCQKPVGLSQVKIVKATRDDISQNQSCLPTRGIIVSLSRFTAGAKLFAKYYNITLEKLSDQRPYRFNYVNFSVLADSDRGFGEDLISVDWRCSLCGTALRSPDNGTSWVCPVCDNS